MKRSTGFAIITVILIILILQSFGVKIKFYEKTKHYASQEEVINDYLKNVNFMWTKKNNNGIETETIPNLDYYETISKRHRLVEEKGEGHNSTPYFKEYIIEDISVSNTLMLNEHLNTYKKIENYKIPEKREIYKVSGKGTYIRYTSKNIDFNGNVENYDNNNYEDLEIYLVVVDEGEGYVIDDCIDGSNY